MLRLCCDGGTLQRSQACSIFLDNLGGRESSDAVPLRSDEELTPSTKIELPQLSDASPTPFEGLWS